MTLRPNLHIIGAQKCGTSALAHFLAQHTDICVVANKEAHVFDNPEYFAASDPIAYAEAKYQERLPHFKGEPIICDATPITWYQKAYLAACYQFNPSARFIVVLRDPVARALSHYSMSVHRGSESRAPLRAFWEERQLWRNAPPAAQWPMSSCYRDHSYLDRGRYSRQLRQLFMTIPASQILVLCQRQLSSSHNKTLRKVFHFLHVPYQTIAQERIFESQSLRSDRHWHLASWYARAYYLRYFEFSYRWRWVIKRARRASG